MFVLPFEIFCNCLCFSMAINTLAKIAAKIRDFCRLPRISGKEQYPPSTKLLWMTLFLTMLVLYFRNDIWKLNHLWSKERVTDWLCENRCISAHSQVLWAKISVEIKCNVKFTTKLPLIYSVCLACGADWHYQCCRLTESYTLKTFVLLRYAIYLCIAVE